MGDTRAWGPRLIARQFKTGSKTQKRHPFLGRFVHLGKSQKGLKTEKKKPSAGLGSVSPANQYILNKQRRKRERQGTAEKFPTDFGTNKHIVAGNPTVEKSLGKKTEKSR